MQEQSFTILTPGKLMVAGEFAVLEPYHQLVVMAVNRYVYVNVKTSESCRLTLSDLDLHDLTWEYQGGNLTIETSDHRISFVKDAMAVTLQYLDEQGFRCQPCHLIVKSELDDASGAKYGLGSSAAVVTAVVSAILHKCLPEPPSRELTFRLSAISHVKTQGSGSGADVAASSFGGFLQYASFQAKWLTSQLESIPAISEIVTMNWPYLSHTPITLPENIHLCVGWTGSPASTVKLIDKIKELKTLNSIQYEQFLQDSEHAVQLILDGFNHDDIENLMLGVKKNRLALRTVGEQAGVAIETPLLAKLCDLAEQLGGAGKPSGAGGGDCGIAFMPNKEQAMKLMGEWERAGIKPLAIQPVMSGVQYHVE